MCDTAYQIILSFPEDELVNLWCDLANRIIFSRDKIIFSDGIFHDCGGAEILNSVPLIDNEQISEDVWKLQIEKLFSRLQNSFSLYQPKYKNFYVTKIPCTNEHTGMDYNHRRLSLELYIMFHAIYKNFKWDNPEHFMQIVANDCVIYKNWLI